MNDSLLTRRHCIPHACRDTDPKVARSPHTEILKMQRIVLPHELSNTVDQRHHQPEQGSASQSKTHTDRRIDRIARRTHACLATPKRI